MREPQKGRDICILIVDSLHCTAEANTTHWSNYAPINKKENRNENKNILQLGGGAIWESGSMKSCRWGSSRSTSVQVPVSPWPGPSSPHLGQLWRQGPEEKGRVWARCMVRWFVGSCYTFSFISHWPIWLTGDLSWQGRRHREYVVCVQAIVCPTEGRASIPNKEGTNHVLHSHGFQGWLITLCGITGTLTCV